MRELSGVAARAARLDWRSFARNMVLAFGAGVFLALVGAMGTLEMPLSTRIAFWAPLMMLVSAIAWPVATVIELLPAQPRHPALLWAILTLAVTIPGSVMVWGYITAYFHHPVQPERLVFLFWPTLVITGAMTAIGMLVERPGAVTHAPAPDAPSPAARARFLERLPAKLMGGALYAVKAEDHYLRLYTSKGEDLILMRLSDALVELAGLEGAQTHRSWWVAKDAVQSVKRGDGKVALLLPGGLEAPVSRANVKPLREEGWI